MSSSIACPKGLAELQQSLSLCRARMHLAGNSRPEDLVFLLQILDVFRQLFVRGGSDESQQWVENFGHFSTLLIRMMDQKSTFLLPHYVTEKSVMSDVRRDTSKPAFTHPERRLRLPRPVMIASASVLMTDGCTLSENCPRISGKR